MLAFAVAALLLIMIPGPDQALVTRNALAGGRGSGLLTVVGGVLGLTLHATAAAVGLSALLLASPAAFTALKIVGAAYLLWLGAQTLRAAWRTLRAPAGDQPVRERRGRWAYLRQGFLSNALNPKVTLFFVTFLPQFIAPDSTAPHAEALLLSVVFGALYVAWFGLYVSLVDRLARWLRKPTVKARIEQITGLALVTVAIRLATD
jgi:RhtB (resistance to homoserine/threonine) family protein